MGFYGKYRAGLLFIFAVLTFAPDTVCSQPWLSEDDRLARGEVIISFKEASNSLLHDVEGVILIDATPELIWSAITDYASYSRIFPSISESEVLEHKGNATRVRIRVNNLWPYPDFEYVMLFKEDRKNWIVSWSMEEGNIKTAYGSCGLQLFPPDGTKTKIVYLFARDPGWLVLSLSRDLDNRNIVIERLLALRKEIREVKKAKEGHQNGTEIKPMWRKALFWWEKDEQEKPEPDEEEIKQDKGKSNPEDDSKPPES